MVDQRRKDPEEHRPDLLRRLRPRQRGQGNQRSVGQPGIQYRHDDRQPDRSGQQPHLQRGRAQAGDQGCQGSRQGARVAREGRRSLPDRHARLARRSALPAPGKGRKGQRHARRVAGTALISGREHMRKLLIGALISAAATHASAQQGPAERATAQAIKRVQRIDPQLGSVLALDPTAIEQARRVDASGIQGPLAGQPVLIKDNIEAAGPLPTTAGSLALANNVTNRDAPLVRRLRAAGGVILGKTNLSEWANIRSNHSVSGWSAAGGQTRNPWALDRNPCGSSSGSGAAVAAGLVRFAIGTETDGSITCPAAINGIVGLKPTVGLVSRTHIVPISHSQDTAGPMGRSVRDVALLFSAMVGSDPADSATTGADAAIKDYAATLSPDALKGVRLGVIRPEKMPAALTERFEAALAKLKAAGADLVEVTPPKLEGMGDAEFDVLKY